MRHLLIVEDDQTISELLTDLLTLNGYSVRAFLRAEEALDFLRISPPFDLILLDLMMPEVDGTEFRHRQLEIESWRQVPVVIMSAGTNAKEKQIELQAKACLRKPFEVEEVLRVVEETIATPRPEVAAGRSRGRI